MDCQALYRI